jgi:hypothetical protein
MNTLLPRVAVLCFAAVVCLLCGCKGEARKHYYGELISFDYPESWTIRSNKEPPIGDVFALTAKEHGAMLIYVSHPKYELDLDEIRKRYVTKTSQIASPLAVNDLGFSPSADGYVWRFALTKGSQSVPVTVTFSKRTYGEIDVAIVEHALDENRKKADAHFQLVRNSIKVAETTGEAEQTPAE